MHFSAGAEIAALPCILSRELITEEEFVGVVAGVIR